MQVAARVGAWAKSGGYTAKDYVQDGLIAMWDGIENAGWAVHDPNATVWKDLSGNGYDFTLNSNAEIFDNSVKVNGRSSEVGGKIETICQTIEIGLYVDSPIAQGSALCLYQSSILGYGISCFVFKYNGHLWCSDGDSVLIDGGLNIISATLNQTGIGVKEYFKSGKSAEFAGYDDWWKMYDGRILGAGYQFHDNFPFEGMFYFIRLYDRQLTSSEIAANYAIDKARFNLSETT